MSKLKKQEGAVSLFIVVFSAIIITIIAVSYTRIMVSDQQQATAADLSQSAYDSAQAGVEDAKRALLRYQDICNQHGNTSVQCNTAKAQVDSSTTASLACNASVITLNDVRDVVVNDEVPVKTSTTSSSLNQAYTCVKINLQTPNYLGLLTNNESNLVPIKGTTTIDRVKIEWFDAQDVDASFSSNISLLSSGTPLIAQATWPSNRPPIMRLQIMNLDGDASGFTLDQLNNNGALTYSNTLFLYPNSGNSAQTIADFSTDARRTYIAGARPTATRCLTNIAAGGYACSMTLRLPAPVSVNDMTFLRVSSMYNKANYRITLQSGGTTVNFNGVQPEIDSTGRANDLFRRVKSRVEMSNVNFPYPEAAVDITGSLCKNFWVTDSTVDYGTVSTCNP